jgi:hypothetical protein
MKSFFIISLIATFFTACSPELEKAPISTTHAVNSKIPGAYPANPDNPYDMAGEIYYDVSESYIAGNYYDEDVDSIIISVQGLLDANPDFVGLKTPGYVPPSDTVVEAFLTADSWMLSDAIATSGLQQTSQQKLSAFFNQLSEFESGQKPFDVIYPYIMTFEKEVITSNMVPDDREAILTISSIMRYSFFFARKRKQKPRDRNWDVTTTCMIIAVEGTKDGTAKAIALSIVGGIAVNNY